MNDNLMARRAKGVLGPGRPGLYTYHRGRRANSTRKSGSQRFTPQLSPSLLLDLRFIIRSPLGVMFVVA